MGNSLRRVATKCANAYAANQLADYFNPIHLEVGNSGGSETAGHATMRFIESMPDGYLVAKIDVGNAFKVCAESYA